MQEKDKTPAAAHQRRSDAPGNGAPPTITARILGKVCGTTPEAAEGAAEELRWALRTLPRKPMFVIGEAIRETNMLVRELLNERRDGA